MEAALKQYGPKFLADQTSVTAQKKFLIALQEKYTGLITNDNVMRFSVQYGFALENAFRAIQQGIDNNTVDAARFDDNVLYITHRQEFVADMPERDSLPFNNMVTKEIARLNELYQKEIPNEPIEVTQEKTEKTFKSETTQTTGRKIRPRMRP